MAASVILTLFSCKANYKPQHVEVELISSTLCHQDHSSEMYLKIELKNNTVVYSYLADIGHDQLRSPLLVVKDKKLELTNDEGFKDIATRNFHDKETNILENWGVSRINVPAETKFCPRVLSIVRIKIDRNTAVLRDKTGLFTSFFTENKERLAYLARNLKNPDKDNYSWIEVSKLVNFVLCDVYLNEYGRFLDDEAKLRKISKSSLREIYKEHYRDSVLGVSLPEVKALIESRDNYYEDIKAYIKRDELPLMELSFKEIKCYLFDDCEPNSKN